jgi:diguanylate cyclase (GGDEF)-like protein/PAS domain S-box-containing protein
VLEVITTRPVPAPLTLRPDEATAHPARSQALPFARMAAHACALPMALVVWLEGDTPVLVAETGLPVDQGDPVPGLLARLAPALETPARPPLPGSGDQETIHLIKALQLRRDDGTVLGLLAVMDTAPGVLGQGGEQDLATLGGLLAEQLARMTQPDGATVGTPRPPLQPVKEDTQRLATRLGITLNSITEGFYTLDPEWRFTFLNPHGEHLLGRSSADLLGKSFWREFPGAIDTAFSEQMRAAVATGQQVEFESPYVPTDTWFEVRVYPFAEGVAVYFRDVGEKRKAREQLMLLETSISRLNDIVLITEAVPHGSPRARIIFVNNAFERHTGYSRAEAMGQSPRLLCGPLTQRREVERIFLAFQRGEPVQAELVTHKKDGRHFWMEVDVVPVADDAGRCVTHWVAVCRDITRRKTAESEIKHLAFYDPLTQLPNRQLLMDRLQLALSHHHRRARESSLMFIDLDNFKALNDTLGHHKGDLLLQQVAERLSACVRKMDTVARLGGDEFVVMLDDLGTRADEAAAQTKTIAENMLAALSEPYLLSGNHHYSTCSIGVTSFNQDQTNIGDLLKQADLAMYQAKTAGRNTICFFDPVLQAAANAHATLQSDLHRGLREGEFALHYQPQVGRHGRMTGVEALLRWTHPERGAVLPAEFIPAAEDGGLILPLGQWALETACEQLAVWSERPETAGLSIAVNVSVRQFKHPEFADLVMTALQNPKVSPHKLKLELTESLLAEDMEVTIAKMARLKSLGVTLALDDFGMGYSSLSMLKRLPLDQLKIDKSFVADILTDPNDAAIARTIIGLAQSLGLGVMAEGVENEAQRVFLAHHGCECYQGYLFSRPLPIAALEDFMKALPA